MAIEQPAVAGKFSPRDHPNWWSTEAWNPGGPKLFLIYPLSIEDATFTKPNGSQETTRIVTADVAICDLADAEAGTPYTALLGVRIGGKALVPQLSKSVGTGNAVAGRLKQLPGQGEKSGAFVLDDYLPTDVALLNQVDALPWRAQTPAQPNPTPPASAYPASAAAPTPPTAGPAPAATSSTATPRPAWSYLPGGTDLFAKLSGAGVDVSQVGDLATAQMIANSLPG